MASSLSYAFVTLLTSDSYLPGALALVAALRDVHASAAAPISFQTVCLITPENLAVETQGTVRKAFDVVVGVDVIREDTSRGLSLLGRPDLALVLTKLHVFRLTQFDKIIFLDADVLPIRPLAHLFTLPHEFSAVPDVGWPDIFNSGLMVFEPGQDKFDQIMQLVRTKGSWDGGDQGVLNEWRGGNWNRLSFTYNTTPTAAYTYAPAYERFGKEINAIHFIGKDKPWKSLPWRAPGSSASAGVTNESIATSLAQPSYGYSALIDKWFDVYDHHYRPAIPSESQRQELMKKVSFQPPKYPSAWNAPTAPPTQPPPPQAQITGGSALGLDELKALAIGGVTALANQGPNVSQSLPDMGLGYLGPSVEKTEAYYITMPMPGQIELKDHRDEPVYNPLEQVQAYRPEPSQPLPWRQESDRFQEPSHWAPPATATSSPPAHLFRPKPRHPSPGPGHDHHNRDDHRPPSPPHDPGNWHGDQSGRHDQHRPQHHHQSQQHYHRHVHHPQHEPLQQQHQGHGDSQQQDNHGGWHQQHHHHDNEQHDQHHHGEQQQHHHGGHQQQHHHHHDGHQQAHHHHHHDGDHHQGHHQPQPSSDHHEHHHHEHQDDHGSWHQESSPHQAHSHHTEQHYVRAPSPQRPRSPPMINWNPAVEPPPDVLPPGAYDQPTNTYFTNVWDMPQHHNRAHQADYSHSDHSPPAFDNSFDSQQESHPEAFFQPPTVAGIPTQLVHEGHYTAVTSHNPQPDRKKVAAVFPWENKVRPTPGRVFPRTDTPPPAFALPPPPAPPSGATTPKAPARLGSAATAKDPSPPSPPSDPPSGLRVTRQFSYDWQADQTPVDAGGPRNYGNAWDTVPSIQRYVTKLARPSSALVGLTPPKEEKAAMGSPGKTWSEKIEESDAASHEADDEDDESDVEEGKGSGGGSGYTSPRSGVSSKRGGKAGRTGSGKASPAVRPGISRRSTAPTAEKGIMTVPSGSGSGKASGTPQYRSQSVQTVPKNTQSRGVQVNRPPYGNPPKRQYRNTSVETSSASPSPLERKIPLPASQDNQPGVVASPALPQESKPIPRPKREMAVAFAPTPSMMTPPVTMPGGSAIGGGVISPPGEKVISPRMNDPTTFELRPFVPQPQTASTPTITTPAATSEAYRSYPFSRAKQYSPTTPSSSNRDSMAFSAAASNRDSIISTDAILTPRSSVILNAPSLPMPHIRTSSNETGLTGLGTTPPTSAGPMSPIEDDAVGTKFKKPPVGRQWDPRRNVDLFKTQSQDVLARFLQMSSWDPTEQQRQQSPVPH